MKRPVLPAILQDLTLPSPINSPGSEPMASTHGLTQGLTTVFRPVQVVAAPISLCLGRPQLLLQAVHKTELVLPLLVVVLKVAVLAQDKQAQIRLTGSSAAVLLKHFHLLLLRSFIRRIDMFKILFHAPG